MNFKTLISAIAILLSSTFIMPVTTAHSNKTEDISTTDVIEKAIIEDTSAETVQTTAKEVVLSETTTESTTESTAELTTKSSLYSEDDLFCLAAAVCREAGGLSEETQLLVANVIINRVNSKSYPSTVRGVLTQYMQYGMMWKYGVSFPSWATKSIKNQCYDVAQRILDGERICPENVVFQAEFKQGSGVYKSITENGATMYFCYK